MQYATSGSRSNPLKSLGSEQNLELLKMLGLIFLVMLTVLALVSMLVKAFRVVTREADTCPRCHGTEVRQSHYRGNLNDWLLGKMGCMPVRCRNCHRRYYARRNNVTPAPRGHALR